MDSNTARTWRSAWAAVGCALLLAGAHASETAPADVSETIVDVPKSAGIFTLKLETTVYKPAGDGPFPLIVLNHGKARGKAAFQSRARYSEQAAALEETAAWPIDFDGGNGRLRRQRLLRLRRCWRRSCILLSGSSRRVRCKTSRILPVESSGTLGFDDQHSAPTQSATKENESLDGRLVNPRCQGQLSLIHHFVH